MSQALQLTPAMWTKNALEVDQRLRSGSGETYRVVRFLARGGFSEVYEAVLESTGEVFAIKCLQLHRMEPKSIERTRREGSTLANLRHPNIVRVFEYTVRDDGLIWMVMELLVGRTLRNLIEQTKPRVPVPWALRIAADLARGLEELHRLAIHRDLKPENIHVSLDGLRICLFDLGAGKVLKSSLVTTDPRMSMGSLPYMSPEQLIDPQEIDPRSDLFALGTIFYEMLTGKHPFTSQDGKFAGWGVLSKQIIESPHVDMALAARHVPKYVVAIVDRLLQKDPEERFPSAAVAREHLEKAVAHYNHEHPSLALAEVAHTLAPEVLGEDDDLAFMSGEREKHNPFLETPDPLVPFAVTESLRSAQPEAYRTTDRAPTPEPPPARSPTPSLVAKKTIPMSVVASTPAPPLAARRTEPINVAPPQVAKAKGQYDLDEGEPYPDGLLIDDPEHDTKGRRLWIEMIRLWNTHTREATKTVFDALYSPEHPAVRVIASTILSRFGGKQVIRVLLEQYAVEKDVGAQAHLQMNVILLRSVYGDDAIDQVLEQNPVSLQASAFLDLGTTRRIERLKRERAEQEKVAAPRPASRRSFSLSGKELLTSLLIGLAFLTLALALGQMTHVIELPGFRSSSEPAPTLPKVRE